MVADSDFYETIIFGLFLSLKGVAMQDYIVCEKRGNHPRIHVKICSHRCQETETCEAFQDYMDAAGNHEGLMRPNADAWSTAGSLLAPRKSCPAPSEKPDEMHAVTPHFDLD